MALVCQTTRLTGEARLRWQWNGEVEIHVRASPTSLPSIGLYMGLSRQTGGRPLWALGKLALETN